MGSVLDSTVDDSFVELGDVWAMLKDYFKKYRSVPDLAFVQEKFGFIKEIEVAASSRYYADQLKEKHVERRTIEIMSKAGEALKSGRAPNEVLALAQKNLVKLNKYTATIDDLDITDIDGTIEHWENVKLNANEDGTPGISTGIDFIDATYSTGLAPGQLIVTFGYSGRAKTWVTSLLATQAFERGFSPMYVSLEMPGTQLRDRLITTMGDGAFSNSQMARGNVDLDSFRSFAKDKFDGKPKFHIVSNDGHQIVNPNMLQGKIEQHSPDIVVVDFLQLMMDNNESESMSIRMMNLIYQLKNMAMANDIPVLVISSVTPKSTTDQSEPPTLDMTAWSSAIDYSADLAMAIHRNNDSGLIEVVARKSRHSELFSGMIDWDFDSGTWNETYRLPDSE